MKLLGRIAAACLAFLFVLILPCAVWTFSIGQMALDADTYKNALSESAVYSELIPMLLPALDEGRDEILEAVENDPDLRDDPEFAGAMQQLRDSADFTLLTVVQNLNPPDWAAIAELLIPADWLQSELETNIDAFFGWLNQDVETLNLAFDTGSLRERISGEEGQRAVNLIIDSWPPCSDAEVEQLDRLLNSETPTEEAFPFCQPPGTYLAFTSYALSEVLRQEVSTLPDVFPEPGELNSPGARADLNEIQRTVRVMQALSLELWLMPVALLSLIVFFTVRSLKAFGRWSGGVLIIGGVFTLLPVPFLLSPFFISSQAMSMMSNSNIRPGPGGGEGYLASVFESLARSITGAFTLPLVVVSGLLIGAGFLALIIAALAHDPDEIDAEQAQSLAASGYLTMPGTTPTPTPTGTGSITPTAQAAYLAPAHQPSPTPPPEATPPPAADPTANQPPADDDPFDLPPG